MIALEGLILVCAAIEARPQRVALAGVSFAVLIGTVTASVFLNKSKRARAVISSHPPREHGSKIELDQAEYAVKDSPRATVSR
jgi:hypothetical protein